MSILTPANLEVFTVRVYKQLTANPAVSWANTYEFRAGSTTTNAELLLAVIRAVAFESELHLTDVQFTRAILSTWVPDGEPYDPTTFVSLPQTLLGQRSFTNPEPLQIVFTVRKDVNLGRYGFWQFRRVLAEGDVQAPAGTPALANQAGMQSEVDAAITASGIDLHFVSGTSDLKLVMYDGDHSHDRFMDGFTALGVGVRKFNNRYFDVP